ncbi:MAG: lysophospholipid acyltransferase family protein, partial [FCB group bacterium]|nr:lysophospholipid acyltransferase family protein [FCB group bacterium]
RIRYIGEEYYKELEQRGENYIFTLWHGRMLLPIYIHRKRDIVAMVSQHVDGEIIARGVQMIGYTIVRGSSSRGGGQALRQMVKIMKEGHPGAMMPDGPKGPRGDFKTGTITLAQLTGAYILPITHAASKAWVFNSWDRFMIAKPFSKVVIAYGEPVKIPRNLNQDEIIKMKKDLERRMDELVEQAENYIKQKWK